MSEWKESATPVKDWIAKQEKKIELYSSPKNDHESVAKQRQEVEVAALIRLMLHQKRLGTYSRELAPKINIYCTSIDTRFFFQIHRTCPKSYKRDKTPCINLRRCMMSFKSDRLCPMKTRRNFVRILIASRTVGITWRKRSRRLIKGKPVFLATCGGNFSLFISFELGIQS